MNKALLKKITVLRLGSKTGSDIKLLSFSYAYFQVFVEIISQNDIFNVINNIMKNKSYSVGLVTEKQIQELMDTLGANASEVVRLAVRELYNREVKNAS